MVHTELEWCNTEDVATAETVPSVLRSCYIDAGCTDECNFPLRSAFVLRFLTRSGLRLEALRVVVRLLSAKLSRENTSHSCGISDHQQLQQISAPSVST